MMRKLFLSFLFVLFPIMASSQWRVALYGGISENFYNNYLLIDNVSGAWGPTAGIMCQYNLKPWLGLRADINWIQKNRRGAILANYKTKNDYVQLPVWASFSIGCPRVKAVSFMANAGVFGAYCISSRFKGSGIISDSSPHQRSWEAGLAGGAGCNWRICSYLSAQLETTLFYGLTGFSRPSDNIKDTRYNTTLAYQLMICYHI